MTSKLLFVLQQYALLGAFAITAFGLGRPLVNWGRGYPVLTPLLRLSLRLIAGMGVTMMVLFAAGTLGFLNPSMLAIVAPLIGLVLAIGRRAIPFRKATLKMAPRSLLSTSRRVPLSRWWWIAIGVSVSLPLLVTPFRPPFAWDELAYHLPYARFWAEQGALTVNEWLRYPLSAYNMNLLYAAALIVGSDVLPHLLHALTGALAAVLTYGVGRYFMPRGVGLLAMAVLVYSTRWGWRTAYVDLGLMLFWSAAFAALAYRHASGDRRFVYLAAFLGGIAIGIKYQGLFYLPVFVVLALVVERRPGVIVRAASILALAGGYWYLRNYLISGDPIHPLGGPWFGFWLWTPDDLAAQFGELDQNRGFREWLLYPAVGAPLLWRRSSPFLRGLLLSAAASVALWYLVSGYWRYLVPVYPMLALLSASVMVSLWRRSSLGVSLPALANRLHPRLGRGVAALVLVAVAFVSLRDVSKGWTGVFPEEKGRSDYLAQRLFGYTLIRDSGEEPVHTLYQLGFEKEIYYLGDSVRGDWFGPGRYSDTMDLAQDAGALARHLMALGADALLVNLSQERFSSLSRELDLADQFELVRRSEQAALYRLLRPEEDADAGE